MSDILNLNGSAPDGDKNVKRSRIIAGIICSIPILYILYKLVPYGVTLVNSINDLISAVIKGGALLIGAYILWLLWKALRGSVGHFFEKLSYRALDAIIASRPTESMRIEISKAEESKRERTQGLSEMIQVVNDMKERQDKQNAEAMRELKAAAAFKKEAESISDVNEKQRILNKATLAANNAGYKTQSNDRMKDSLVKYNMFVQRMQKLADSMEFFITDQKNLCDQLEQDWLFSRKMRKGAGTVNQNLSLIDDNSIFMRAGRIAQEQIRNNIAYVEAAFQNSKSIIEKADLEKGILDISSQELLGRYESGEFDQVIDMMNKKSNLQDLKDQALLELKGGTTTEAPKALSVEYSDIYKK